MIINQIKKNIIMGCGCKNKQQAPITAAEAAKLQQESIQSKQNQNESIKQTIKKTVEKYYNVDKKNK